MCLCTSPVVDQARGRCEKCTLHVLAIPYGQGETVRAGGSRKSIFWGPEHEIQGEELNVQKCPPKGGKPGLGILFSIKI